MNVVVTNLAWILLRDLDPRVHAVIRNDLTVIPRTTSSFNPNPEPIRLYAQTERYIGVPRAYYVRHRGRWCDGALRREEWRVSEGNALSCSKTLIKLRPEDQEIAVATMVSHLKNGPANQGLMCAFTGFGKSLTGLEMIARLGRNCLLLAHREGLLVQWSDNIKRFWPEATIGMVQGDQADYVGKDITLAMVQTLASGGGKRFPKEFWESFGTIFVDEIHCFGSRGFGSVTPRFSARYMIGVSGTIRRGDGCEDVFRHVLGDVVYTAEETNRVIPKIYVRDTGYRPHRTSLETNRNKAIVLSAVEKCPARAKLIAEDVVKALKAGRNPLVMSERLAVLRNVHVAVQSMCKTEELEDISHGFWIGGMKAAARLAASKCRVVYATLGAAKEGIDIPRLDTLLLATPVADPEQAIGRVCRKVAGKKVPFVIDYVDFNLDNFRQNFHSRLKLYRSLNWDVTQIKPK